MRLITRSRLVQFWSKHADAEEPLTRWYLEAKGSNWSNLVEVRQKFPSADPVKLASGKEVVVFNIAGNKYRLITAIHYNHQITYLLRVLTHKEYSRNRWKEQLS